MKGAEDCIPRLDGHILDFTRLKSPPFCGAVCTWQSKTQLEFIIIIFASLVCELLLSLLVVGNCYSIPRSDCLCDFYFFLGGTF